MIIKDSIQLGKLIRQARRAQNLTQTDLAFAANTGVRFIVDVENGKSTAQIGKVLQICNMLGLTVDIN